MKICGMQEGCEAEGVELPAGTGTAKKKTAENLFAISNYFRWCTKLKKNLIICKFWLK